MASSFGEAVSPPSDVLVASIAVVALSLDLAASNCGAGVVSVEGC